MQREYDPQLQKLLECWLPLAQQVMSDLGWQATPSELEALIINAADELATISSASSARAVLWRHYMRNPRPHGHTQARTSEREE
jgi:hypothetical protein